MTLQTYNEQARIVTDHHTVRLPLRVNWGGGWSDTPPYCNEKGGTVLNAAILLNGEKPVAPLAPNNISSLSFSRRKLTVSRTEKTLSIRKEFASTCSAFL